MVLLKKIWELLFRNFMWLYVIMGLLGWIGIHPLTFHLLVGVGFLYGITLLARFEGSNLLDISVIVFVFYVLFNTLIIDYPNKLACLKGDLVYSVMPFFFYIIGKTTNNNIEKFLKAMIVPMIIVSLIGIVLYFVNPPWYTAARYALLSGYGYTEATASEEILREVFRLSSIWNTSYVIGYANAFFLFFLLNQLLIGNLEKKEKKLYSLLFLLSIVIMILSGFRAIMLSFVLALMVYFIFSNNKRVKSKIFWRGGIIAFLFLAVMVFFSSEYYEYFIERFSDVGSNEGLSSRFELTSKGIELNTAFGDGFGHHGMGAKDASHNIMIEDSEYQKILAELGYIGLVLFLFVIMAAALIALKTHSLLELTILITFTVSFIGSSSISAETTFPFIFWYSIGCISRKGLRQRQTVVMPRLSGC